MFCWSYPYRGVNSLQANSLPILETQAAFFLAKNRKVYDKFSARATYLYPQRGFFKKVMLGKYETISLVFDTFLLAIDFENRVGWQMLRTYKNPSLKGSFTTIIRTISGEVQRQRSEPAAVSGNSKWEIPV